MDLKNLDLKNGPVIIGERYLLKHQLGEGSFGQVFSAVDQQTNQTIALKLETKRQNLDSTLMKEKEVLCNINNQPGFPRYLNFGKEPDFSYLAMSLFAYNLEKLFRHCQKRFSLKTVLMIVDQMLTNIEALHKKGYLHRDIKPANFCMGVDEDKNSVHLIDFGLSKKFLDSKGQHLSYKENKGLIGTAKYASVNTHMGIEQSRRDDLESIGYMIIYFLQGTLPWQSVKAESKAQKYALIKEKKSQMKLEELCKGLPEEIFVYFSYVKNLQFDAVPDYKYLKQIFQSLFSKNKFEFDYNYDWTQINPRQNQIDKGRASTENPGVDKSELIVREGSKAADINGKNKTWVLRPLQNKQSRLREESDLRIFFTPRKLTASINSERSELSKALPNVIEFMKTEPSEIKSQYVRSRLKDCLTQRMREKQI